MSAIDRSPPADDTSDVRTSAVREARLINARAKRIEGEEQQHQLDLLDDSIAGTDREELARLRMQRRGES